MKNRTTIVAVTLLSLTAAITRADPPAPATAPASAITFPEGKDSVTVPLARARENLCVKVSIDGQPAAFYILDTGASHGIVDPTFAEKHKLPIIGDASVLGTTGSAKIRYRQAHTLDIAGVSFANPALIEQDLAKSVYALDHIPMKGILGYDFLSQLPFTIDFQAATLTLHRPGTFTPPKGATPFTVQFMMGCPAIRTRINNQAEGFFLLDTGAAGADLTALGTRLVPDVERQPDSALVISSGVGGTEVLIRSPVDFDYLGHHAKLTTRFGLHKPVGGLDSAQLGRLGYDCFANSRLTIAGDKLYAEWLDPLSADGWIKAAGDPKKPDLLGSTVLTRAAKEDRIDAAKLLLDAGVDAAATDRYGGTALFAAAQNGNLELVELLLKHKAPPDVVTKANEAAEVETPLQIAAENGHEKIVAALLKAGASTAGKDPFGRFPLQQAAMAGHADCCKLLLEAGADPNHKIPGLNLAPLHFAAIFGHADVIETLLANKADPAITDSDGNTPLHLAAFNKRDAAAAAILSAKPEVDARNNNAQTPLMAAALNGCLPLCKRLLEAGADPAAQDRQGKTVLQYAGDFGDPQILKLLTAALAPKPPAEPAIAP